MMTSDTVPQPVPLVERLQRCAELYAATPDGSLARLGKRAVNDGAFFDRLGERGPTTATLEKFARFLTDPANWPEGEVPEEAKALAHAVGVSPTATLLEESGVNSAEAPASAGRGEEISPQERAA